MRNDGNPGASDAAAAPLPPPPGAPSAPTRGGSLYVAAVIALGCAVVATSLHDLAGPVSREWLILLALTVVSDLATLRIPGMPISFSISDVFSLASALVFGPAAGAVTAAVDGLVLSARMATSRRSFARVAFNASALAIATWAAAQAFVWLAGPRHQIDGAASALWLLASVTVFGALDYVVNTGLVATAISLDTRTGVVAVWRQHFSGLWLNYFGGVFGGMLLLLLAQLHTIDAIILLIPLPVILYMAFHHAVGRTEDQIVHLGKVQRVYVGAIEALAHAVDAKDQVTHDHVRRVQTRSVELARTLGVEDDAEIQAIKAASLLHDIGKLAIPEHILNKPGRLSPAEFAIMKRHAPIGADILSVIDFPYPVAPIVRHHHENWDGTGYPDGLAADAIPIGARIIAVVDCFDALTSDRPYRPRLDDQAALRILADRKGTMYDPRVVDAFFACHGADRGDPVPLFGSEHAPAESTAPAGSGANGAAPLEAFFHLGRAMARAESPRSIDLVWSHLQAHLPDVTLVLYVYDPSRDAIVVSGEAGAARSRLEIGESIPLGERLSGWVAATREVVINSDARLDFDEELRTDVPFRSALALPIIANDRVVGVLSAYACEPDAFAESHRMLLLAAAGALASRPSEIQSAAAIAWTVRRVS